ncbi:MAG TPA: VOC family protein [Pirellulaceae bacterium]|nr:VOC family protein [Pirellulaceae bacterium]HMO92578.1 VOC family protein [Pirellulaceae bacterium]HMP70624.1 VOC family protein [Pirellulaceae bacterium]
MKPRISLITIGVDDLERSLQFYRDGLGLETQGIVGQEFEHGSVVFFDMQSGLKLALFRRSDIAHDSGLPLQPASATEFTLAHNVSSEVEVDSVMQQAARAGAVVVKPAGKTFWGGYAGYFQDPDGHLWEIAHNPQMMTDDDAQQTDAPEHASKRF